MIWIAVSLSLVLAAISILHALWASGSSWPKENDEALVQAVVGSSGRTEMPAKWQSAFVALCLAGGAVLPHLTLQTVTIPHLPLELVSLSTWALTIVFLGRGLIGTTPWFRKLLPGEPFVSLNRKYYSPLCLIIGAGFLILLLY